MSVPSIMVLDDTFDLSVCFCPNRPQMAPLIAYMMWLMIMPVDGLGMANGVIEYTVTPGDYMECNISLELTSSETVKNDYRVYINFASAVAIHNKVGIRYMCI